MLPDEWPTTWPPPSAWSASPRCSRSSAPRRRRGERVLVLGATGAVGQVAVQLAKLLGAGRVVGAGRNAERFERVRELGADAVVELGEGDLAEAFEQAAGGQLDVVIDPLWGEPAMAALRAIATERAPRQRRASPPAPTSGCRSSRCATARARSTRSPPAGPRSSAKARACTDRLLEYALAGHLTVDREVVPLEDVAAAWQRQDASPGRKLVIALGRMTLVGRPVRRREDDRILRGRTRYLDDIDPPGRGPRRLRAQPVRARPRSAASACPTRLEGVLAVITAADLEGRAQRPAGAGLRGRRGRRRGPPGARQATRCATPASRWRPCWRSRARSPRTPPSWSRSTTSRSTRCWTARAAPTSR